MRFWKRVGDRISGSVRGSTVQGPVSIGKHIDVLQKTGGDLSARLSDPEIAEVRNAFADLRSQVEAGAGDKERARALERVDELEEALTAAQPDLTTAELVVGWFRRNVPTLAGGVVGVVVNPIVGKLVASAGDAVAAEFEERVRREI